MTLALYQRIVLTRDIPEEGLRAGDVGVIVEHYPARANVPEGYELEVFAATGQTIAVVSVPADAIREATEHEVLSVRELAGALSHHPPPVCPSTVPLLGETSPNGQKARVG